MINYLYDLVILFIFILVLHKGYKRGLLYTLVRFVGSLIAIVLSFLLVNPFTNWLLKIGFLGDVTDTISTNVTSQIQSVSDKILLPLTRFMPEKWARNIFIQTSPTEGSLAVQAGLATAKLFLSAIAFLILFLIFAALFSGVSKGLSTAVNKIPLIGWVNRFGGLLLSVIYAFVIIWFITMVLTALSINSEFLQSILLPSKVVEFFSNKDIFMSLLDTIF